MAEAIIARRGRQSNGSTEPPDPNEGMLVITALDRDGTPIPSVNVSCNDGGTVYTRSTNANGQVPFTITDGYVILNCQWPGSQVDVQKWNNNIIQITPESTYYHNVYFNKSGSSTSFTYSSGSVRFYYAKRIKVTCIGGGGGGYVNHTTNVSYGGGGGGITQEWMDVTRNTSYYANVGDGGNGLHWSNNNTTTAGGHYLRNSQAGEPSIFANRIVANGGGAATISGPGTGGIGNSGLGGNGKSMTSGAGSSYNGTGGGGGGGADGGWYINYINKNQTNTNTAYLTHVGGVANKRFGSFISGGNGGYGKCKYFDEEDNTNYVSSVGYGYSPGGGGGGGRVHSVSYYWNAWASAGDGARGAIYINF